MGAKHIPCGRFANESERHATEYVRVRLESSGTSGQWFLLTNYANSSGSQYLSDELDMITVGPPGVSLIEIKHWNNADINNRDLQNIAEHEADKLNEKARRLAGKLRKSCAFDVGFVEGKLLVTKGENEKFKAGNTRKRIRGIAVFGLTEWKDLLETSRSPILTDAQVVSICRVLQPNVNVSPNDRLRVFQDFFDLEPVDGMNDPFHRVYRGVESQGAIGSFCTSMTFQP